MNNITKKLILLLFICVSFQSFSQEFYPLNFFSIVTDEGLYKDELTRINENYISQKGFEYVNDSTFINPISNEKILGSSTKKDSIIFVSVSYFTVGNNLEKFKKRLNDKRLGLTKINEKHYQYKDNNVNVQFLFLKDTLKENEKFEVIKLTYDYKRTSNTRKYVFPLNGAFPFQNTSWNFDISYKKSQNYEDKYYVKMDFTKEDSPYKIEFIDDIHYIITFTDNLKKIQEIKGKYDYSYKKLNFETDYEIKKSKPKTKDGIKLVEEIPELAFNYIEVDEVNKLKNTKKYFKFFFNKSFTIGYSYDTIYLESTVYDNSNPPTIAPSKEN